MEIVNKIGRRKTAVARVYVKAGSGVITVNKRDYKEYFPTEILQTLVNQAFIVTGEQGKHDVYVNVKGGGVAGQAVAVRHAISRVLSEMNQEFHVPLKKEGFLTRDPRMVERKKYGRAKARKRFQFSKR